MLKVKQVLYVPTLPDTLVLLMTEELTRRWNHVLTLVGEPGDSEQLVDAIGALLQDERRRAELARAGQEYVHEHHRIEVMTDRYVDVLQSCGTKDTLA